MLSGKEITDEAVDAARQLINHSVIIFLVFLCNQCLYDFHQKKVKAF